MNRLAVAESGPVVSRTEQRRKIVIDTRLAAGQTIAAAAWLYCTQFVLPATPFIRLTKEELRHQFNEAPSTIGVRPPDSVHCSLSITNEPLSSSGQWMPVNVP